MKKPTTLAARLEAHLNLPAEWNTAFDAIVHRLRKSGAASGAPRVGDVLTDFALPDADGRLQTLSEITSQDPFVLSFNRGSWCPFCEEEVTAWAEREPTLAAAGVRLVVVTPETGGKMQTLAGIAGHRAVVLCDADLGVALRFGLAIPVGPTVQKLYLSKGLDLAQINGSKNGLLPVPSTFLVDRERIVRFAYVEPDFRLRAEPEAVLAAWPQPSRY